ncbi:transglutaminase domain-containing protein [Schumannella sp. 10F1B-5-1]|uniref:transglutaminase family protein n=1 Tax=Schumannella sp. 10F1B-5-1 TaxID=2590780 RepID=UPI001131D1F8|nr:transglutaminase domain-containing protein [Schumannella sp. 10F1B-5-1]TPW72254.1 transglutaminase domain-containing protein [Schumannella sp. 10F1B-5-1]
MSAASPETLPSPPDAGGPGDARPAAARTRPAPRAVSLRSWTDVGVIVALTLIGLVGLGTAFTDFGYLLAGVGGIVVGGGVAFLAARYRLGALTTVAMAVVAYFLLGSALAIPEQALLHVLPTLQTLSGLAVGAVFGWADLITLRAPVSLPYYVNAVPYVSTWLVSLVSVTLALRWLADRRRTVWRASLLLIGPAVVYVAGVLLGTDEPYFAAVRGVAFAGIALIWLGWRRREGGRLNVGSGSPMLRRKIAGTAIVVVAAVIVGAVGGTLLAPPPDNRFVLREQVQPPFEPLDYPAPLAGFRKYTKDLDETKLFTVSGLKSGDRIRLATMDTYDGVVWGVAGADVDVQGSGSFRLVGRTMPAPSLITRGGTRDLDVTVDGYSDVWIPDTGYATGLDVGDVRSGTGEDVRYNGVTGTAVMTTGLKKGDEYRVEAVTQRAVNDADLEKVPTASMALPPVRNIPDVVAAKASEWVDGKQTPIEQVRAIAERLSTTGYLSHGTASDQAPSRAGHGSDRMAEMVEAQHMVGDEEQYASLMALMTRSLNMPTRVVMGFKPDIADGGGPVTVTGDDVTAWVEVAFEGVGWLAFDPTPDDTDVPQDQTPKPKTEPQPQVRQPPRTENDQDDLITPVEIDDSDKDDDSLFQLPAWVIPLALSILIPLAIVFLPMLVIALLKRRRMGRRRRPGGDRSVAGAWDEMVDRLSELGFDAPTRVTRPLVAQGLAPGLGAEGGSSVTLLAERTDQAVFAGQDVAPERVDAAWDEALGVVAGAGTSVGRGRRLLSRYRIGAVRRWAGRLSDAATAARRRDPGAPEL